MTEREHWLVSNRQAVERRVQWLHDKPDGVLCVEQAGIQFATVIKRGPLIRLVLVEQAKPQSNLTQSALDLRDPLHLVSPYTQAALLGLAWPEAVRSVYVVGLGGGRVPLVLHHYLPEATVWCAEIEPAVVAVAEKYFGLRQDSRLEIAVADGRDWLARQGKPGLFDMIFLDAFLGNRYTPYRLATLEFYRLCRDSLTPEGVLVLNMLTTDRFYHSKVRTLQSAFPAVVSCPAAGDNQIFFASRRSWRREQLLGRATALQELHHFSFSLVQLADRIEFQSDLRTIGPAEARTLTDDEPPPGYLDDLPSFHALTGGVAAEMPCPCGSGRRFGDCHRPDQPGQ